MLQSSEESVEYGCLKLVEDCSVFRINGKVSVRFEDCLGKPIAWSIKNNLLFCVLIRLYYFCMTLEKIINIIKGETQWPH